MDYDRMFTPREQQLEWCRLQVDLAVALDKPLFLHVRERDPEKGKPLGADEEMLDILEQAKVDQLHIDPHLHLPIFSKF